MNPQILAQGGMPADGVMFAICLSAAVATLVMGLYASYPIGLAPGMSLMPIADLHSSGSFALRDLLLSHLV